MPLKDQTQLSTLLAEAGIAPATAEAVMTIDSLLQRWRRRVMKRELGIRALRDLKVDIDLAQYDVLAVIVTNEDAETSGEVMVATVAERLNIDPSRASRLVSEMVDQGFVRRAVSQADARRTIIELTGRGQAIVDAVRAYKFLVMGDFLAGWDPRELAAFVPMLDRFAAWIDSIEPSSERHAAAIAALAADLADAADHELL
jgi:DNA-binding MarR family transcriptional regulator